MPREHVFESVASELVSWIEDTGDYVVEALLDHGRGPFTVKPKPAAALLYYDKQFFNPDGSPNVQGRTRELDRLGAAQFARTMRFVAQARERGVQAALAELAPEVEEEGAPAAEGVGGQQGPPGEY